MSTFGPLTPNAMRYEVYIATVEEKLGNLSNVDLANVLLVCTEAYQKQPFESLQEEIQHTLIYVGLARKVRTDDNPSFASVMRDPTLRERWMPSIKSEIDGLIKIGALGPCTSEDSIGQELLPILIQLKCKRLADQAATISKLKARAYISGDIEKNQFGMFKDRSSTFSPNVSMNTFLLFLAVAVKRKWILSNSDITSAYTNAPYNRQQPLFAYTTLDNQRQYYRVGRMIYGMCDAGQAWYFEYRSLILELGYVESIDDPCLFSKVINDQDGLILCVTTDDAAYAHSDNDEGYGYLKELRYGNTLSIQS